ncbi:hypothetical protein CK203_080846 [Vitis vinifera]|uniref:Uncharacterized protein n=1 Tax=Vitis vinifera TaxID=29760 RepID=A0A438C0C5_VITVI|nr:hypothetical protein CK203_080846 [Vitis vinifera]
MAEDRLLEVVDIPNLFPQTTPIVDARLIRVRSSLRCASHSFCPMMGELGELLPCTKDVRTSGPGTPLRSLI